MDEPDLTDVVIDILEYARSGPPVDDLLAFFTSRALTLVDSDTVVVRPHQPAASRASAPDRPPVPGDPATFPVCRGPAPWGELLLTDDGGPLGAGDARRGRFLAEVLGAALAVHVEAGAAERGPDELVDVVLDCVDDLDRMPDASTRSRLALVVDRLADALGAPAWSVSVLNNGWLHDVSNVPAADGTAPAGPGSPRGPVPIARFPARRRASAGDAFYADRHTGDQAERRVLAARGHFAVIGAGGYDLDGRAWVAEIRAGEGSRLDRATPVLAALVMAALSSPREASVPRPEEHWVRAVLDLPAASGQQGEEQPWTRPGGSPAARAAMTWGTSGRVAAST